MTSILNDLIEKQISVLTNDGRNVVGILQGVDQMTNIILTNSHERIFSESGTEKEELGLYIVKGDNVAVLGEIDEDLDAKVDFQNLSAEQLRPITH
mmetsp:Transcript_26395/g.73782  ORF Transcript_26395/g.73782 Transcript_26395/m.73782 type:complete len:96 (+) Transcript_26395:74-361(+)|eukprot:CAMPEP_0119126930 /NCGR_PEP_ID=MMETSP1310-20130426/5660_1 /TAXON_ID=464262 /ORGANISM="Genus nov. species nov., Strain RCC2339" /LENGTH=95 /DNA_ID=CAMNT_0007117127 /DNA_START=65 /DNA_END=352 /DNA_ORIENTATION=+